MADEPAATLTYASWIVKRGGVRKSWKRRWMTLESDGWMRYYKSQFDFKKQKRPKPAGEIHLGDERALVKSHSDVDYEWPHQADPRNAFCVATQHRIFYFICEKNTECLHWKGHLSAWVSTHAADNNARPGPRGPANRVAQSTVDATIDRTVPAKPLPLKSPMRVTIDNEGAYSEISPDGLTPQNSSPSNRGQVTYSTWMPPGPEAEAGAGEQSGPRNAGNLEELYSVPKKATKTDTYANVKIPPKSARLPQPLPPLEDAESSDSDHDEGHGGPRMRAPTVEKPAQMYENFVPGQSQRQRQLPPKATGGSGGGDGPELPAKRSPAKSRPRSSYENVGVNGYSL